MTEPTPAPTVGRIVHYFNHFDSEPKAAIVTHAYQHLGEVALRVFDRAGEVTRDHVPYSEEPAPDCWTWPPRV